MPLFDCIVQLSPALRNRFTEIWCPASSGRKDLTEIIEHNLEPNIHLCNQQDGSSGIGHAIMDFIEWFSSTDVGKRYAMKTLCYYTAFIPSPILTIILPLMLLVLQYYTPKCFSQVVDL